MAGTVHLWLVFSQVLANFVSIRVGQSLRNSRQETPRAAEAGENLGRTSTSSPPPAQSVDGCSRLFRVMATQDVSISMDGDLSTSLGNLFQSITLTSYIQNGISCVSNGISCVSACSHFVLYLDSSSFDSQYTGNQIKPRNISLNVVIFCFFLVINNSVLNEYIPLDIFLTGSFTSDKIKQLFSQASISIFNCFCLETSQLQCLFLLHNLKFSAERCNEATVNFYLFS